MLHSIEQCHHIMLSFGDPDHNFGVIRNVVFLEDCFRHLIPPIPRSEFGAITTLKTIKYTNTMVSSWASTNANIVRHVFYSFFNSTTPMSHCEHWVTKPTLFFILTQYDSPFFFLRFPQFNSNFHGIFSSPPLRDKCILPSF